MTATTDAAQLLDLDREHLWHPYTSMTDPAPTRLVTGARGTRIQFGDGTEAIDAMASWWSAIHGYRHPQLDAAVATQVDSFAHVMFGGLTHEPAVNLARQLVEVTPPGLEHVFLADSGSVSVEVALKMALQFQRGIGRPGRTRMLTVRGGYHGDTFAAMSVCDPVGGMHSMFTGSLPPQVFTDRPPAPGGDLTRWADGVEELARRHADELAGIIVEPLLQGAGGMRAHDPACLSVLGEIADRHDLVLIFDEIATGFGRTGSLFVSESVRPDILCLGKALTGGYMTLAATLCTRRVAEGVSRSESGVLMHGPTFMGNPLACAVASASIDILTCTDWRGSVERIRTGLEHGLAEARALPGVVDVRTIGAVGVVELERPVDLTLATDAALAHGVWLRPFRNLIYTMPPYVATDRDVASISAAICAAAVAG